MQLTPAQQAFVSETDRNCCALSIPGSGKTFVITRKLAPLLQAGRRVTVVTFTREAGHELKSRVRSLGLTASELAGLEAGTFHSIVLQRLRALQPEEMRRRIAKDGECRTMMARAIESTMGGGISQRVIDMMEAWRCLPDPLSGDFRGLEDWHVGPEDAREVVAETANTYMRLMHRAGLIDFTEIMWRGLELVRGWRGARLYADESQAPARQDSTSIFSGSHVLVDEMQDVDAVQLEYMLQHFHQLASVVDGVGDDDQSIYAFRKGMGIEGMRRFIEETGAQLINMDTNFRCRSEILDWAGSVIEQNVNRQDKQLNAFRGRGGDVRLLAIKGGQGAPEPDRVAHMVSEDLRRKELRTVAILARGNKKLQEIEQSLQRLDIAYTLIGTKSMWEEAPLCLWVSALGEWGTSGLGEGLRSLLYWCGCNESDLGKVSQAMRGMRLWDLQAADLDLSPKGEEIVGCLSDHWERMRRADWTSSKEVAEVLDNCAQAIGGMTHGSSVAGRREAGLILAKMSSAAEILARVNGTPRQKAAWVRGLERRAREEGARVKLVSMHSSKGLEFDSVYIVNATEKSLPGLAQGKEVEEERRVLYVGMTRAKEKLTVTFVHDSRNRISPFLLGPTSTVLPRDADEILQVAQEQSRFDARALTG